VTGIISKGYFNYKIIRQYVPELYQQKLSVPGVLAQFSFFQL